MKNHAWILIAWVMCLLAACDEVPDDAPTRLEDSPAFQRWPSAVLPWKARLGQDAYIGDGAEVQLPLAYRPVDNSAESFGYGVTLMAPCTSCSANEPPPWSSPM